MVRVRVRVMVRVRVRVRPDIQFRVSYVGVTTRVSYMVSQAWLTDSPRVASDYCAARPWLCPLLHAYER